jgi:hypothetical protein
VLSNFFDRRQGDQEFFDRPNVAQPIFVEIKTFSMLMKNMVYLCHKRLPIVNNRTLGEFSANLVTLYGRTQRQPLINPKSTPDDGLLRANLPDHLQGRRPLKRTPPAWNNAKTILASRPIYTIRQIVSYDKNRIDPIYENCAVRHLKVSYDTMFSNLCHIGATDVCTSICLQRAVS